MNPFDALRRRMGEYKQQMSDYLMSGGPRDHSEYLKAVAKVEAIEQLLGDIEEIEQQYIDD